MLVAGAVIVVLLLLIVVLSTRESFAASNNYSCPDGDVTRTNRPACRIFAKSVGTFCKEPSCKPEECKKTLNALCGDTCAKHPYKFCDANRNRNNVHMACINFEKNPCIYNTNSYNIRNKKLNYVASEVDAEDEEEVDAEDDEHVDVKDAKVDGGGADETKQGTADGARVSATNELLTATEMNSIKEQHKRMVRAVTVTAPAVGTNNGWSVGA